MYESKGKLFAQKPLLPPGMSPEMAQKAKEKREREQRIKQQREAEANRRPPQNPVPGLLILNGDSKINQPQQRATNKPAKPKKKAVELPDVLLEQKQKEEQKQKQQKSQKVCYSLNMGSILLLGSSTVHHLIICSLFSAGIRGRNNRTLVKGL